MWPMRISPTYQRNILSGDFYKGDKRGGGKGMIVDKGRSEPGASHLISSCWVKGNVRILKLAELPLYINLSEDHLEVCYEITGIA